MRTIKLTDAEVATIEKALNYAYNAHLKLLEQSREILGEAATLVILKEADKYIQAIGAFEGEREGNL